MSACHTHKWTSTSSCSKGGRPICARGRPGHPGALGPFHLPWLGTEHEHEVREWPVINEASFEASRHPGLLLSGVPSADVNNKSQSGIIRPPDARGVHHFNHVCVMNAAAVNHCLFIMSAKRSCNVVLMLVVARQRWCVSVRM